MFSCAKARRHTTSWKFLHEAGCASEPESLALISASRRGFAPRKGASGTNAEPQRKLTEQWCVPELRLLENGREDRTPVRAVRRAAFGCPCRTVCQFRCRHTLPAATRIPAVLHLCTVQVRPNQQGRIVHTSLPGSDGALADYSLPIQRSATFLLESLILAQDERWRRA
jgi:hypothetical protein